MSSLKRKSNSYSLAIIFLFSSQLVSTSVFARNDYTSALSNVIDGSYSDLGRQNQISSLKHTATKTGITSNKQTVSSSILVKGEYFTALDNVIGSSHSKNARQRKHPESINNNLAKTKDKYIDKEVRDEFESSLFKTTTVNFESYLDLDRNEQREVITIYSDKNSMDSAIAKLRELSDQY